MRTITNADIAELLLELAQYLGEQRGNAFRAKAYRRAARTIREMGESFAELVRTEADLTQYPGISEGLGRAIREIETGTLRKVEALRTEASPERVAVSEYLHLAAFGKRLFRTNRKIEDDVARRRFQGEFLDTAGGGMDALERTVEGELAIDGNDQLTIENELFYLECEQRFDDFRKVTCQRLGRISIAGPSGSPRLGAPPIGSSFTEGGGFTGIVPI